MTPKRFASRQVNLFFSIHLSELQHKVINYRFWYRNASHIIFGCLTFHNILISPFYTVTLLKCGGW